MYGELIPVGGGDPIPLLKKQLRVGRRESCDIVLRFANVSAHHCVLIVDEGYWFVKDLGSRNGVKVNGIRITPQTRKRLDPGTIVAVAKHKYEVKYNPVDLGAMGPPPSDDVPDFLTQSLLEKAGLERKKKEQSRRYDVLTDKGGVKKRTIDD
jgi:pSer/pThr/pTyr-binding forkhead associated (FHA) protein